MNERPNVITDENILTVDVEMIEIDRRFSDLSFQGGKKLSKIQKWLKEIEELGYTELLIRDDIRQVEKKKKELGEFLESILLFDTRTTRENAENQKNELEARTERFFNDSYQLLAMKLLPFLRQEVARASADFHELERQQKAAVQAEREYQALTQKLTVELEKLKNELDQRKNEVSESQGEIVAIGLGKYFEKQAEIYTAEKGEWFVGRNKALFWMYLIVGSNIALYIFLFTTNKIHWWPDLAPEAFFTLQYGLVKLALLLLLSYAVGFASRNYSITSGLVATNTHRKNVAETLLHALASPINDEGKAELMRVASSALFSHLSLGYIRRENMGDSGPMLEALKKISSVKE